MTTTGKVWMLLLAPGVCFLLLAGILWKAHIKEQRHMNRLGQEKSPYLLQHASNPVDWYPWGEEAFEKARREQKPIFLSVGYSTCHWCHVMEEESFVDPAIGDLLNRSFVAIKVDREERPDVDRVYMTFVQATTGGGGWPMSVFLTPDRRPFLGGTYFPKEDHSGRPGFRTVLKRVAEAWSGDRERVLQSAGQVVQALQNMVEAGVAEGGELSPAALDGAYRSFLANYDAARGGFGGAPKFPRPSIFNFLLRYHARTGDPKALEMTLHTLRAMAAGGMHDHLGGGFHRYSVDPTWHVPHFEKMLYDQAQLAVSYSEAYQISGDRFFAGTARDILEYVLRDMRSPEGGFFSAEDADSPFERGKPAQGEGVFYIWKAAEIETILGQETAAIFDYHYGVSPDGNVPHEWDQQSEFRGRNILIERHPAAETARRFGKSEEETRALLAGTRKKLFEVRAGRPRPGLDDKILAAWNGLMISALARAAQALPEAADSARYSAAARAAAVFLEEKLYDPKTGRLKRRYRAGEAAIDGFVDDYAFLIRGLLDLYETTFEVRWLNWAIRLQETQDHLFWDPKSGAYFSTSGADPSILVQMREDYDGAEPAPNSVAALNLLRLAQMTDRKDWREKGEKTLAVFARRLEKVPETLPQMATALDFHLSRTKQIIIAGQPDAADTREMVRLVHHRYLPNKIVMLADGAAGQQFLARGLPFVLGMTRKEGRATAYVCENYTCKLPATDLAVVAKMLDGKEGTTDGHR